MIPSQTPFTTWVDHFVGYIHKPSILPLNSCSTARWLTFDFEATQHPDLLSGDNSLEGDPKSFRWLYQLQCVSNYVHWRVLDASKPGLYVGTRNREYEVVDEATWLGQNKAKFSGDSTTSRWYVINSGCHDSCWRGHADSVYGYPQVPAPNPDYSQNTRYFNIHEAVEVKVHGVYLSGPSVHYNDGGRREINYGPANATWDNPDPENLVGVWALATAYGAICHQIGIPAEVGVAFEIARFREATQSELEAPSADNDLDIDYRRKRVRLTGYDEPRYSVRLRFNTKGQIVAWAVAVQYDRNEIIWNDLDEPVYFSRQFVLSLAHQEDEPGVDIRHLWPWS